MTSTTFWTTIAALAATAIFAYQLYVARKRDEVKFAPGFPNFGHAITGTIRQSFPGRDIRNGELKPITFEGLKATYLPGEEVRFKLIDVHPDAEIAIDLALDDLHFDRATGIVTGRAPSEWPYLYHNVYVDKIAA